MSRIMNAFNEVEDQYLDQMIRFIRFRKIRKNILRLSSAVACLGLLCMTCIFVFFHNSTDEPPGIQGIPPTFHVGDSGRNYMGQEWCFDSADETSVTMKLVNRSSQDWYCRIVFLGSTIPNIYLDSRCQAHDELLIDVYVNGSLIDIETSAFARTDEFGRWGILIPADGETYTVTLDYSHYADHDGVIGWWYFENWVLMGRY